MSRTPLLPLALVVLAFTSLVSGGSASSAPAEDITARMLVQPGALVGPGPDNLK